MPRASRAGVAVCALHRAVPHHPSGQHVATHRRRSTRVWVDVSLRHGRTAGAAGDCIPTVAAWPLAIVVGRKLRGARRGRLRRLRVVPRLGWIGRLRDVDDRRFAWSSRLQWRIGEHRRCRFGHSDVGIARSTRDETCGAAVAVIATATRRTKLKRRAGPAQHPSSPGEEGKRGRQEPARHVALRTRFLHSFHNLDIEVPRAGELLRLGGEGTAGGLARPAGPAPSFIDR